jgi:putative membrane protein
MIESVEGKGLEQTADSGEKRRKSKIRNRRVHMANERTFLAWIRTSIAIMAFGFVMERFSIFLRQLTYYSEPVMEAGRRLPAPKPGYSSFFGAVLVGIGALMGVLALVRFKRVERQIDEDTYKPQWILDIMLTAAVFSIAVFLMIYVSHSLS